MMANKSLAMYAMKIAENNMEEAKKMDDNDETKKEKEEKIEQATREINAANSLLEGNIEKAFSSLCYFRDR
jgi:hypothetical protein